MVSNSVRYVDGVLVSKEVLLKKFQCDIAKCHGGCCYVDDPDCLGAPLTQAEATAIRKHKVLIAQQLWGFREHRRIVLTKPLYTHKRTLPFRVRVNAARCVLCDTDGCVLRNSKEVYPEIPNQPISCALYPLSEGWDADRQLPILYIEHYFDKKLCHWGYKLGAKNNVYLIDFCKDAIIRRYGEEFYKHLKEAQDELFH